MTMTFAHKYSQRKRCWLWGSIAVGTVLLVYLLSAGKWNEYLVQQELERLRAAGIPTTAQELNRYYAIPVGEPDAKAAWMKPINALSTGALGKYPRGITLLDKRDAWPPPPGDEWEEVNRAQQFIADHQQLYQDIETALAEPGRCCFVPDFSAGAELLLPHAQEMRTIVQLLALRAFVNAHRGDTDNSLRDLEAMLTATNTLTEEPVMVTQLVRVVNARSTLLALERLLPSLDCSDDDISNLQSHLAVLDFHRSLQLMVLGDRVMGLTSFHDPATAGAGRTPAVLYRAWVRDNPLEFLRTMRLLEAKCGEVWPEPLAIAAPLTENTWQAAQAKAPVGGQTWHAPTKFAETITSHITTVANVEARARAAVATLAAVRFRRSHERWPNALAELVPEFLLNVPLDPFNNETLKFSVNAQDFRVYSVGSNLRDDGGVKNIEENENGSQRKGKLDVVFRVRVK